MKTLIVYASKYGCTEKCSKKLADKLTGNVDLVNLKENQNIDVSKYEKVLIGGSIYLGRIHNEVGEFSKNNLDKLLEKKVGLFICCMREGELVKEQINAAFPDELISRAIAIENFGGEFLLGKMSFIDKLITKKVAKITTDESNILEENINSFAQALNRL